MPDQKIILDLCGGSGAWSAPYADAGYDVVNVTLPEYNVLTYEPPEPENVYGILTAPPCDQFSYAKTTGRPRDIRKSLKIIAACYRIIWDCQVDLPSPYAHKTTLKFWALENPDGLLQYFMGRPIFEFNPYDFGDDYQKRTCLWGYFNNPVKRPSLFSGLNKKLAATNSQKLPKGKAGMSKSDRRAITPAGFANAFFEANK